MEQGSGNIGSSQWHFLQKYLQTHYPVSLQERVEYLVILSGILQHTSVANISPTKHFFTVIYSMIEKTQAELAGNVFVFGKIYLTPHFFCSYCDMDFSLGFAFVFTCFFFQIIHTTYSIKS